MVHHRDAVAHRQRLLLVVGDEDERRPQLVLDPLELQPHLQAELHVERARAARPAGAPRAGSRALARGRPAAAGRRRAGRAGAPRSPARPTSSSISSTCRVRSAFATFLSFEPVGDVLADRHVREQRVVLEAHVDLALVRRDADHVGRRGGGSCPSVGSSNPAIMRIVVVLPQPDGPRSVMNSPSAISSETSSTATTSPKVLRHASDADRGIVVHVAILPGARAPAVWSSGGSVMLGALVRPPLSLRPVGPADAQDLGERDDDRRDDQDDDGDREHLRQLPWAAGAGRTRTAGTWSSCRPRNDASTISSNEIVRLIRNADTTAGASRGT